jgi:phosphoserine aminotransferase
VISVDLTDLEAESFKAWREHQDEFQKLVDSQLFDVKSGVALVHFNHDGTIVRVEVPRISIFRVGVIHSSKGLPL